MRNFEHTFNVLTRVIEEEVPFKLALKSTFKNEKRKIDSSFKSSVASMSGCVLRNYFLFKELVNRKYPDLKENKFLLIGIGLADHIFRKDFDEEELLKYIKKETELEDVDIFIKQFEDPKTLIPEDIPVNSHKYFSLRFNLPLWIVRMWHRNCGEFLSRKLFFSISYYKNLDVRINSQNISEEEFLNKYKDFTKSDFDGYVSFVGEGKLKSHPSLEDDALFIPRGYKYLFEGLDLDPLRGIAIYGGCDNFILKELYLRLGTDFKADYVAGHQKHYFRVLEDIKKLGLRNVSSYEVDVDALRTCISKPVHNFFLCPRNSNFEQLIYQPDYFLYAKQELLDEFIEEETKSLNNAATLVEDGGNLIYLLPTVCRNETKGVIHRFLDDNPEFELDKEIQLFPFDKYKTMLYFAVLRKEVNHD